MNKEIVKRYSQAFKQQVVREYETGSSIYTLLQKYGIGGYQTVQRWIAQFSVQGVRSEVLVIQSRDDQLEVKAMKVRLAELEQALADSVLETRMLTAILETASQGLGLDLKKNFGKRA